MSLSALRCFVFPICAFPFCPGENPKDRLVEVLRLVSEHVMTGASDHLTDTDRQKLILTRSFKHKAESRGKKIKLFKATHNDFYIRPGFLHCISRVAVDARPRSVNERNGDVASDPVDPLQHRPLCPSVGNGHVPKGRLSTDTEKSFKGLNRAKTAAWEAKYDLSPWCLGIEMIDVVRHGVVVEHRSVLLLEI